MSLVTQSGIVFGNGDILNKDPMRMLTQLTGLGFPAPINGSMTGGTYFIWNSSIGGANARGVLYGVYWNLVSNGKTSYYSQIGASAITVSNYTDSNMRITLVGGVYSGTDDYYRFTVYRDGSQVNSYTHSGGTLVMDSGSLIGVNQLRTSTITQDIASNTSSTFYLYAGVLGGSNYDSLSPVLKASFNSWI